MPSVPLQGAQPAEPNGYVDLQSPSGLGLSVLVYNYDGDVYASDEGRMLAEVGDKTFRLGNVHRVDGSEALFLQSPLLPMVHETMAEGVPRNAATAPSSPGAALIPSTTTPPREMRWGIVRRVDSARGTWECSRSSST